MREANTIELRWFLGVIRRRIGLIIGCTLLALLVAIVVTSRMPPAYEATTTLLVVSGQDIGTADYNSLVAGERLALTYNQMLKERSVLVAVIARLGLAETVDDLTKQIQTESVKDTQLIRVTVRDASPARAALLANTIADVFTARAKALQENRFSGATATMQAKVEAQRKLIEDTQVQVDNVSAKEASDKAELTGLQGLAVDYRTDYRNLQRDTQALQLSVDQLKNAVRIVEPAHAAAISNTTTITATIALLVDQTQAAGTDFSGILASEPPAGTYAQMLVGRPVLTAAIADLKAKTNPDDLAAKVKAEPIPGTQLMRLTVEGADAEQAARMADAIARAFVVQIQEMLAEPYAARLTAMQEQLSRQEALIADNQAAIQAQAPMVLQNETELTQLQSLLAEYRSDYRTLQQSYEQLRLTTTQAPGTVQVTEPAVEPQEPVQNRWLYIVLAALVALFSALGIAFVLESLDDTIMTPQDVSEALGLITVGTIERFPNEKDVLVVDSQPQSNAAEAFRLLAANVRLSSSSGTPHSLLVTSTTASEGKSVVAANLAVAMATAGLSVVLVDADLRLPRQHELFGLGRGQGLAEALRQGGLNGNLQRTAVEGVKVLTSGALPRDPVETVSSRHMSKLITALAGEADLVVIDSPPILSVADTTIVAAAVDSALLVIRAGHTRRQAARRAVEALRQTNTDLIGVVLNAMPVRNDGYYGYYRNAGETVFSHSRPKKATRVLPWRQPHQNG